ncbi:hypothetical protein [Mangrovimonas futianensis]|uniref:hypothetical protein n=1 Tax=Mangrovimonas futianensis TaxID=2895523 RepID=UPI001E535DA4|nr:hypothetical protein [Mangrovimonas futianensis]MCF1421518.1 hypothetical protein [Mangrovimonas futianensis]
MKKSILITLFILAVSYSNAQNFVELANYEFKTPESYQTEKSKVLMCANYLFDNPANKSELNRLSAIQYIMKWMTGTPDYSFEIGEKSMDLTKGNSDLLGLYMAAMSKVVLENEGTILSNDEIYKQSEALLVTYCANSENHMKPSKKIRKILKNQNG